MSVEAPTPAFDLDYAITDFEAGTTRDSIYIYEAIEDTMVDLAAEVPGGLVLDVACGTGKVAVRIAERGCSTVGAEASMEMIGLGRYVHPETKAVMVRSIAEELPFPDNTFDISAFNRIEVNRAGGLNSSGLRNVFLELSHLHFRNSNLVSFCFKGRAPVSKNKLIGNEKHQSC